MPLVVQAVASQALIRRVESLRAAARPNSPLLTQFRKDAKAIVELDHEQWIMQANKTDRGQPRADLRPSTLKKPRQDPRSLMPRGPRSRFLANVRVVWQRQFQAASILVKQFVDIVDAKGRPIAHYHLTGTRNMAKRSVGGISPRGMAWIIEVHKELAARIAASIRR